MKVAFLGSFGFGNLGDELCLFESLTKFGGDENFVWSIDPYWTDLQVKDKFKCSYFKTRTELSDIKPDRIVFGGGGVGFLPSIKDALHWMHDSIDSAELIINNIGVAAIGSDWVDPTCRRVLDQLSIFSVRDLESQAIARLWGREPDVTYYPEVDISPIDPTYVKSQPLHYGISITTQANMWDRIESKMEYVKKFVDSQGIDRVSPIVSTVHKYTQEENDAKGFSRFCSKFGLHNVINENFLDYDFWYNEYNIGRLRASIASCHCLITQRKHNMVHAIGTGTRFIGFYPENDDSLARVYNARSERVSAKSFLFPV